MMLKKTSTLKFSREKGNQVYLLCQPQSSLPTLKDVRMRLFRLSVEVVVPDAVDDEPVAAVLLSRSESYSVSRLLRYRNRLEF